jgi:uridylate kinase
MDAAAVSLSRENKIPIIVFSIHDRGSLAAVLRGEGRCTIIEERA